MLSGRRRAADKKLKFTAPGGKSKQTVDRPAADKKTA
jgi:hypothetical protein